MKMMQRVPSEGRWLSLSAGFVATTLQVGCATVFEETDVDADAGDDSCSEFCDGECCAVPTLIAPAASEPIVRPLYEPTAFAEAPEADAQIEMAPVEKKVRRRRSIGNRSRKRANTADVLISAETNAAAHGSFGSRPEVESDVDDAPFAAVEQAGERPARITAEVRDEDPVVRSLKRAVDGPAPSGWSSAPIGGTYPQ